jgi:putative SOS response-associated peptidase YedK
MCERFSQQHEEAELVQRFQIRQKLFRPERRYNIAPTQQIAVVTESGQRTLEEMKWGTEEQLDEELPVHVRGIFR